MICKKCGKRLRAELTVCPHCGTYTGSEVSLGAIKTVQGKRSRKPKRAKKKASRTEIILRVVLIIVAILAVLAILLGIAKLYILKKTREEGNFDDKFSGDEIGELDLNTALPTKNIQNIVLFGLDERGDTGELYDGAGKGKSFHSDSIIILTIDRRNKDKPRVKMSSLARDTLVYVEGYGSKGSLTKLTHAFDFGYRKAKRADKEDGKADYSEADYKREGAKTAIKAINYNFHMNITEYIYVNFVEFMDIIDEVGGVTIDVKARELNELNKHVRAMRKECSRSIAQVKKEGKQKLSGGQALAYARIRKIDSDLVRANRQRDVLKALFAEVKSTPLKELPDLAGEFLNMCHTTLTAEEVVALGQWAVLNGPEITNFTLPNSKCNIWEGTHPVYSWVWIYDLDYASALLIDYIYDTDTAKDKPKPTLSSEPKVTRPPTAASSNNSIAPSGGVVDPSASGGVSGSGVESSGSGASGVGSGGPSDSNASGSIGSTPSGSSTPGNSDGGDTPITQPSVSSAAPTVSGVSVTP